MTSISNSVVLTTSEASNELADKPTTKEDYETLYAMDLKLASGLK